MDARGRPTGWGYRPELDGLRSVAVYLVLLFHCQLAWFRGGFVGVDLFFVLSGFLVSHVILDRADRTDGRFGLGWFYARRVRRLLPAAVLVIVVTAAVQLVVANAAQRATYAGDGRSALLYYSNWHFIAQSQDYFAADHVSGSPYLHFWSLSIEEQFYVALPLLLLALLRLRRSRTAMLVVVGVVLVGSVALQVWRAHTDPTYAYYATETRVYQLAAGVLLCLVTRERSWASGLPARAGGGLAAVGLAGLVVVGSGLLDLAASWRGLAATAAAVAAIAGLYAAPRGAPSRLLALPVPRYLGQVSYGTYLWHWPVILVLHKVMDTAPVVTAAFAAALATGLAALSAQLVETPVRRAPALEHRRWPVIAAGLSLSLVAALVVLPAVLASTRRPDLVSARTSEPMFADQVPWVRQPVPQGLDLAAAAADVPDQVRPCTPARPTACQVVRGSGERWLLVGDSQAQMTLDAFTALARDHHLTLFSGIARGCPWQQGLRNLGQPAEDAAVCRAARGTFYRTVLPRLRPDRIVVVTLSRSDDRWRRVLSDSDRPSRRSLEELQRTAGERTLRLFRATGARVTFVHSLVGTNGYERSGPDPLACLAGARTLGECAVLLPEERPFVDGFYDRWARRPGVDVADLTPVICPDGPLCRPVLDGAIVWKDPDHVTATVLTARRALIWRALRRAR